MKKALIFLAVCVGIAIISFVGLRFYLVGKAISAYNEYVENSSHIYYIPK